MWFSLVGWLVLLDFCLFGCFLLLSVAAELDTHGSRLGKKSLSTVGCQSINRRALIVDTAGMFSKLQPPEFVSKFPYARFGI